MIQEIKARILAGGEITEEEALALLTTPHKEELYAAAHDITEHFMGRHSILAPSSTPRVVTAPKTVSGVPRVHITRHQLSAMP